MPLMLHIVVFTLKQKNRFGSLIGCRDAGHQLLFLPVSSHAYLIADPSVHLS